MGLLQSIRTRIKNAWNKTKEFGNRIMQGVTYVAGVAVGYVEQAAVILNWDGLAEASREVSDALQTSHDKWKDRANKLQHERFVGQNTKPMQFKPNKKIRVIGENAIQAIETVCESGRELHETMSRLSPEERLNLIQTVSNEMAERCGLKLDPIKYYFPEEPELGNYSPEENCIRINASLVASENAYIATEQLYTVIHETMHAIQYHAVEQEMDTPGSSGFDPQLVCEWANNFLHYIRPGVDPEGYRNQPLERDAYGIEWMLKNHFFSNNNN